jgi:hypothetical protein
LQFCLKELQKNKSLPIQAKKYKLQRSMSNNDDDDDDDDDDDIPTRQIYEILLSPSIIRKYPQLL